MATATGMYAQSSGGGLETKHMIEGQAFERGSEKHVLMEMHYYQQNMPVRRASLDPHPSRPVARQTSPRRSTPIVRFAPCPRVG